MAYSNLSSETISLSYFAYRTLVSLISSSMKFSDLIKIHEQSSTEFNSDELRQILEKTINELLARGFIYQLSDLE